MSKELCGMSIDKKDVFSVFLVLKKGCKYILFCIKELL